MKKYKWKKVIQENKKFIGPLGVMGILILILLTYQNCISNTKPKISKEPLRNPAVYIDTDEFPTNTSAESVGFSLITKNIVATPGQVVQIQLKKIDSSRSSISLRVDFADSTMDDNSISDSLMDIFAQDDLPYFFTLDSQESETITLPLKLSADQIDELPITLSLEVEDLQTGDTAIIPLVIQNATPAPSSQLAN